MLNPKGPGEGTAVARQIEIQGRQKTCRQGIEAGMGSRYSVEGGDERRLVEHRAHAAARASSVTSTDLEVGVSLFSPKVESGTSTFSSG